MDLNITEKQRQFIESPAFETLFGGAAGGGKSFGQVVDAFIYSNKYPGSKQLILRRTFPELEKSIIRTALGLFPRGLGKYNQTTHSYRHRNGSVIDYGFCDAENDVYKYQSAEYDVIRFDELTHFTESMYLYLLSRCRGANAFPKSVKSTTNPGNVGHVWVKRRFIDPAPPGELITDGKLTRVFIQAFVKDNNFLMATDPDYVDRLDALPDKERLALKEGRWDVFEGQYFSMWDPRIHVIKPIRIEPWWRKYATMDYGMDMLAVCWIAVDELGNHYAYKELHESKLIVSRAIERIYQVGRDEDVTAFYAPPDLWARQSDTGKSAADYFREAGIPLIRSKNDRVQGWLALAEFLNPYVDELGQTKARLRFFETCRNAIRCVPSLQHDDKKPNDCARDPHDITHMPDAIRYYVTERPIAALVEPEATRGYAEQSADFLSWGRAYA